MKEVRCQNCKKDFVIADDDMKFYETIHVPLPTFCPFCRFQRRARHINSRNLYPRILKHGEAPTISMYSQDKKLNIVKDKDWWGDQYDCLSYGAPYDFHESFFTQFHSLWKRVPLPHLQRAYSTFENSDYCNAAAEIKNCYLTMKADKSEDCFYCFEIVQCKNCTDIAYSNSCELCYEGLHLLQCYNCCFCEECESSNNLLWCSNCTNCTNCIGCSGLRNASYQIFNQQLTEEEYREKAESMRTSSWTIQQSVKKQAESFFTSQPKKYLHGKSNENSFGDYLYQTKNVLESFLVKKAENCKYVFSLQYIDTPTVSSYDYTDFGVGSELIYESAWCGLGCHNVKYSLWNYGAADLEYCIGCHYSQKLFGCIGLRHKKYCILNVQYTQDEYEHLVPRIKEQMMRVPYIDVHRNEYRYGEFFPQELSPFDYNQTLAREFCPMSKKEALQQSFGWYDTEIRTMPDAIHWKNLPDDIQSVEDSDIRFPILCKAYDEDPDKAIEHHCTQYFKIIPQELSFYKKNGLTLPRYCHNSRHAHRLQRMNPFHLWDRKCDKCSRSLRSTYGPEYSGVVYCEECYLKEVY